jgi:high-affinity K+ transport system ATPase subunit B
MCRRRSQGSKEAVVKHTATRQQTEMYSTTPGKHAVRVRVRVCQWRRGQCACDRHITSLIWMYSREKVHVSLAVIVMLIMMGYIFILCKYLIIGFLGG